MIHEKLFKYFEDWNLDRTLFGNYNEAPRGFKEVTVEEFIDSHYQMDGFVAIEYRQLIRYDDDTKIGRVISCNLYINHLGRGWGIEIDYNKKKIRYYLFEICEHNFETILQYMCHWEGRCKKCGITSTIDSSD